MARKSTTGRIIIPSAAATIWPHELVTAEALAKKGYTVEFLPVTPHAHAKTPDIIMDGLHWEIKSPVADKLSAIERNLKRATKQSNNIIIDSHRMRKIHDASIRKLLHDRFKNNNSIERLIFIDRKRQVIDFSHPS